MDMPREVSILRFVLDLALDMGKAKFFSFYFS